MATHLHSSFFLIIWEDMGKQFNQCSKSLWRKVPHPHMEESWVECWSTCSRYCGISGGYGRDKSRLKGKSSCLLCCSPLQPALSHKAPSALSTWKAAGAGPPLCQPLLAAYRHGWNGHLKLAQPRLHFPEPVSEKHTHYPCIILSS